MKFLRFNFIFSIFFLGCVWQSSSPPDVSRDRRLRKPWNTDGRSSALCRSSRRWGLSRTGEPLIRKIFWKFFSFFWNLAWWKTQTSFWFLIRHFKAFTSFTSFISIGQLHSHLKPTLDCLVKLKFHDSEIKFNYSFCFFVFLSINEIRRGES